MSHTKPLLMPGEVENLQRKSTADPTGELNRFQLVCLVRYAATCSGPIQTLEFLCGSEPLTLTHWFFFKSVCTCLCGLFKMRNQQVYKKHFGFYLSQLWLKLQYIFIFYILEIKVKMQWTTCLCSSSKLKEPACPSGLQCMNNVVGLGTWLHVIRRNTCMTLRRF